GWVQFQEIRWSPSQEIGWSQSEEILQHARSQQFSHGEKDETRACGGCIIPSNQRIKERYMVPRPRNFVTYYRVSTQRQGRSGLGIDAQRSAVRAYLDANGGTELATYTEIESGKRNDRPQLDAALRRCRQTRATLLVAKLDRLSRNAAFLLSLRVSGARSVAVDMPGMNETVVGILAVIAQHERKAISERTRAALMAAKNRGVRLGNPKLQPGNRLTAEA